jgi:hypothetical protein
MPTRCAAFLPRPVVTAMALSSAPSLPSVPYGVIADCFKERTVVPFLGAAASFVGAAEDSVLPSGAALARVLVGRAEDYPGPMTDSLTKVAQYLEEVPADREYLLSAISRRFFEQVQSTYRTALTDFLRDVPAPLLPRLIVTTNYDVLVERALEARGVPYLAVSHIFKASKYAGRLLCSQSVADPLSIANIRTVRQVEEQMLEWEEHSQVPVIVYKMHGTARIRCTDSPSILDSLVLTENDYVDFFAQDVLNRVPTRIIDYLRRSRLLFLGYALEDWNFRVLLRRLQLVQRRDFGNVSRHWAFLLAPDQVESKFWERRGVNLYELSMDVFLEKLLGALK